MDLIGILDTENNKNRIEYEDDFENDAAIVAELKDAKDYTFKDVLAYLADKAEGKEKTVADEVREYLRQHNGHSVICEIKPCDENGEYLTKDGKFVSLDEKIEPYVTKRNIDGEEIDCLEMVVDQITAVGYK